MPKPYPNILKLLKKVFTGENNRCTQSSHSAYGEPTCESLWKIWHTIRTELVITIKDVLADWGSGAGKMLIGKCLSLIPEMEAFGVEVIVHNCVFVLFLIVLYLFVFT